MNPKASLLVGILCISFSPIFVKLALAPPVITAFYRIFIAWVLLVPYCLVKGKYKIKTKELLTALLGGVVFASDIAVWNLSLLKISATVSTLVANLAPVWVGLLSFLILRKKSGLSFWMGTCIAIAGMVVLVGFQSLLMLQFNIGLIYALIASFLYAIYIMVTRSVLQRIDTVTFMFYNMLAASVFLLLISLIQQNQLTSFSLPTWGCFIGMGVICQLIGWLTINYSLIYIESTKVSIALLSQTVIAGLMAVLWLHEQLAFNEILGSIIVLTGIAVTFLKAGKRKNLEIDTFEER